jgi:phenylalanyl-tRNA synthetase beta chain
MERTYLAGLQLGNFKHKLNWDEGPENKELKGHFQGIKGIVDDILREYPGLTSRPENRDPLLHPSATLDVVNDVGQKLGKYGVLHPLALQALDLKVSGAAFVLDLDALTELTLPARRFSPFSSFPSVSRDISFIIKDSDPYLKVKKIIDGTDSDVKLSQAELIDVYAGKGISPGEKSFTFRLTFSSQERTLRDEEVDAAMAKIQKALEKHGAKLRT